VEQATYLSGVDELVEELPDGWETEVREGRRALSDGERQRVALARTLAADPPILLLDGALSAIDDGTLRTVLGRMRGLATEKTIIVATNRLPVLLAADRVYALQEGRTLEVSAEALREQGENGSEDGVAALFAPKKNGGGRRPVRAAPSRRWENDDHDDDRDEEEDDE
jgi:ABC-type multidrug transport system fused ATPase/permease subunit